MNKIFKVIWSKSKQCYIVVSEIAKNKTGKKKIVVAGIFAALAMVGGITPGVQAGWVTDNTDTVRIGNGSVASGNNGVALGKTAKAQGNNSIAIGTTTTSSGEMGISIGSNANAGDHGVALGSYANSSGYGAFAGGVNAVASGSGAIAIGGNTSNNFQIILGQMLVVILLLRLVHQHKLKVNLL